MRSSDVAIMEMSSKHNIVELLLPSKTFSSIGRYAGDPFKSTDLSLSLWILWLAEQTLQRSSACLAQNSMALVPLLAGVVPCASQINSWQSSQATATSIVKMEFLNVGLQTLGRICGVPA